MGIAETSSESAGAQPKAARTTPPRPAEPIVEGARHVCPFCGSLNPSAAACPRCTMEDSLATREATKLRIGPWFVLQARNPAAPGMKYATLLSLVSKGHVTARSIVRGPTTHQLWRHASQVRGLSREFGVCYSCGQSIDKTATMCPHCERPQEPMGDPDLLLEARNGAMPSSASAVAANGNGNGNGHGNGKGPVTAVVTRAPLELEVGGSAAGLAGSSGAFSARGGHRQRVLPIVPQPKPSGKLVSATHLAAALQDDKPAAPKPRRPRKLLIASGLVAIAAGVLLILGPDTRRASVDWIVTHWQSTKQAVSSSLSGQSTAAPAPAIDQNATATQDSTPHNSIAAAPPPPAPAPLPAPVTVVAPAPAPQPQATKPSAAGVATAADLDRSRNLYYRAIDAESRNDWTEAVKCYEQIQALPRGAWEADLAVRLGYARKMTGR